MKYKFPEDDWVSLSSNLDCNLWTDGNTGEKYMSVYEVIDGQTQATFSLATYKLEQVKEEASEVEKSNLVAQKMWENIKRRNNE